MPKATKAGTTETPTAPEETVDAQTVAQTTEERAMAGLMDILGDEESDEDKPGSTTSEEDSTPAADDNPDDETQSEESQEEDSDPVQEEEEDPQEEAAEDDTELALADEDEDTEDDDQLSPEAQHGLDKKIAKEVARRKSAEEKAQAAEERAQAAEAQLASAQNRHEGIDRQLAAQDKEVSTLIETKTKAESARQNARKFLREMSREMEDDEGRTGFDRVVEGLKGRKIDLPSWEPEGVREWLEDQVDYASQAILDSNQQLVVKRERFNEEMRSQKRDLDKQAITSYPWLSSSSLKDPQTEEAKQAAAFWNANADFRNLPQGRMMLGDLIAGKVARERAAKAKAKGKKSKKAPRLSGAPASAAPTPDVKDAKRRTRMEKAKTTGSEEDMTEALVGVL